MKITAEELIKQALGVLDKAYAPFSGFSVGAALLTKDGRVFTGVNIENSSFGATICAERTAFVKAVSEGFLEFEAIAVVSGQGGAIPCGICRQFMQEFCSPDFQIITLDEKKNIEIWKLKDLFPRGFVFHG